MMWWRNPTVRSQVIAKCMDPESPSESAGVAAMAVHGYGQGALAGLSKMPAVRVEDIVPALSRVDLSDVVAEFSKAVGRDEASSLVVGWHWDAARGARDVAERLVSKGVSVPMAVTRAGAVYGVAPGEAESFVSAMKAPMVAPPLVDDAGIRVVQEWAAAKSGEVSERISKGTGFYRRGFLVNQPRDEDGQFASTGSANTVSSAGEAQRQREQQSEQELWRQKRQEAFQRKKFRRQKREAKQLKALNELEALEALEAQEAQEAREAQQQQQGQKQAEKAKEEENPFKARANEKRRRKEERLLRQWKQSRRLFKQQIASTKREQMAAALEKLEEVDLISEPVVEMPGDSSPFFDPNVDRDFFNELNMFATAGGDYSTMSWFTNFSAKSPFKGGSDKELANLGPGDTLNLTTLSAVERGNRPVDSGSIKLKQQHYLQIPMDVAWAAMAQTEDGMYGPRFDMGRVNAYLLGMNRKPAEIKSLYGKFKSESARPERLTMDNHNQLDRFGRVVFDNDRQEWVVNINLSDSNIPVLQSRPPADPSKSRMITPAPFVSIQATEVAPMLKYFRDTFQQLNPKFFDESDLILADVTEQPGGFRVDTAQAETFRKYLRDNMRAVIDAGNPDAQNSLSGFVTSLKNVQSARVEKVTKPIIYAKAMKYLAVGDDRWDSDEYDVAGLPLRQYVEDFLNAYDDVMYQVDPGPEGWNQAIAETQPLHKALDRIFFNMQKYQNDQNFNLPDSSFEDQGNGHRLKQQPGETYVEDIFADNVGDAYTRYRTSHKLESQEDAELEYAKEAYAKQRANVLDFTARYNDAEDADEFLNEEKDQRNYLVNMRAFLDSLVFEWAHSSSNPDKGDVYGSDPADVVDVVNKRAARELASEIVPALGRNAIDQLMPGGNEFDETFGLLMDPVNNVHDSWYDLDGPLAQLFIDAASSITVAEAMVGGDSPRSGNRKRPFLGNDGMSMDRQRGYNMSSSIKDRLLASNASDDQDSTTLIPNEEALVWGRWDQMFDEDTNVADHNILIETDRDLYQTQIRDRVFSIFDAMS